MIQCRNRLQRTNLWLSWGEGWREGIVREFGMDMYTLLYLKWITNKDLLYSTGNSAWCYVAPWMGGGFSGGTGYMDMYGCPPETVTPLLIGHVPTQNTKLKKIMSRMGREQPYPLKVRSPRSIPHLFRPKNLKLWPRHFLDKGICSQNKGYLSTKFSVIELCRNQFF